MTSSGFVLLPPKHDQTRPGECECGVAITQSNAVLRRTVAGIGCPDTYDDSEIWIPTKCGHCGRAELRRQV